MFNEKDVSVVGIIRRILSDLGPNAFANGKKAAVILEDYFTNAQLDSEKALLQHVLRTGALEFISDTDQYDYATNRKAALFVLTNYEYLAQEWAERVLLWFDEAMGYNSCMLAETSDSRTEPSKTGDYLSPIDAILDQDNTENIVLYNENNEEIEFEQIALIPLNGMIYVILRPVKDMDGVAPDEALVFIIDEFEDEPCIMIVTDNDVVDNVFDAYYETLRESGVDVD